jgi:hypothetical protein
VCPFDIDCSISIRFGTILIHINKLTKHFGETPGLQMLEPGLMKKVPVIFAESRMVALFPKYTWILTQIIEVPNYQKHNLLNREKSRGFLFNVVELLYEYKN